MKQAFQQVVVMGLGYIGLPTASMLATKGHQVLGVDVDENIISTINSGQIHIVEPDLDLLVRSAVNSGNLRAALSPEPADTFILAVPTPFMKAADACKLPDTSFILRATAAIAPVLAQGNLVILESTSPVGTTEAVYRVILDHRPDLAGVISVAHCPERVLPGHILRELVDNDRIIGGIDSFSGEKARELYRTFCNGTIYLTDSRTAELVKLVENSFRDVNIAFANELSMICQEVGVSVWETIRLANRHPRVNILNPGPGVGGHCIAVDPWFVVAAAPEQARLLRTAREVNDSKPLWVVERVKQSAARFVDPVIGCLGLTYKADVDDIRESPALEIARQIKSLEIGRLMVCDPYVTDVKAGFAVHDLEAVLRQADIVVVLVDHEDFKGIDRELLKEKVVIDTRGIWR